MIGIRSTLTLLLLSLGFACTSNGQSAASKSESKGSSFSVPQGTEVATFAGGCFWCTEAGFEKLDGVVSVVSGYAGGSADDATYEQVSSGQTEHLEAVQVYYDPTEINYRQLLEAFWRQIDPTDAGGSFVDRGPQYRSAIFYHTPTQQSWASESKGRVSALDAFEDPIATEIRPLQAFYPAEAYHQDLYKKKPNRYHAYRGDSGRDVFIDRVWSRIPPLYARTFTTPSKAELKDRLNELQYHVTQERGTEQPFKNTYWNNKREGIYVDVVSGEPLFSSTHKFESGTGWPSFTQPLEPTHVVEVHDRDHGMVRTEVRSRHGDSHLGHVFNDGPPPTELRYCINSAALRFVPKGQLAEEGYGEYQALFATPKEAAKVSNKAN